MVRSHANFKALIMTANFSLNIIGSHTLTRNLFLFPFLWMLIENHSGLDFWWGYEKILSAKVGAGATRHSLHHRYPNQYYQPYLCWADDVLIWMTRQDLRGASCNDE